MQLADAGGWAVADSRRKHSSSQFNNENTGFINYYGAWNCSSEHVSTLSNSTTFQVHVATRNGHLQQCWENWGRGPKKHSESCGVHWSLPMFSLDGCIWSGVNDTIAPRRRGSITMNLPQPRSAALFRCSLHLAFLARLQRKLGRIGRGQGSIWCAARWHWEEFDLTNL